MEVSKDKTQLPFVFGGQPALVGRDFGDVMAKAQEAAHTDRNYLVAAKHGSYDESLLGLLALADTVGEYNLRVAHFLNREVTEAAMKDQEGVVLEEWRVMSDGYLSLAAVVKDFMGYYTWRSGGVRSDKGGRASEQVTEGVVSYARAQAEAEAGAQGKLKKLLGRG